MRIALAAALALAPVAAQHISPEEYRARREALRKELPDAVIALTGGTEAERGDIRTGFFQEPNFLYLTGWREPGALMVLAPGEEILFLPARSEIRERYTGRKLDANDASAAEKTGFAKVLDSSQFPEKLKALAEGGRKVYTLAKLPGAARVKEITGNEALDATTEIARLRMVKSSREIEMLQRSVDATVAAHHEAWRRIATGEHEYEIAAAMSKIYFERGCERHAYAPIVGSGPNAVILHYSANKRRMDGGELVLMDVGAECSDYASDITRTVPVSGKFTDRQKEIYEVVLGAQKAAIAAAKPGMKLLGTGEDSLNGIAKKYVETHGRGPNGESLGKYYLHSLGHHVGLDVHDPFDPALTLKPGMVFTIEPGVYIAEEGIGVRIEDMVLITANGAKIMSSALPREIGEIEKTLSQTRKSARKEKRRDSE